MSLERMQILRGVETFLWETYRQQGRVRLRVNSALLFIIYYLIYYLLFFINY